MLDLQSEILKDGREIDKVGVKKVRYPIIVKDKKQKSQPSVATVNMFVQLPKQFRGAHMSRFLEALNRVGGKMISPRIIKEMLLDIKKVLEAEAAHVEMFFPYFIEKNAPASGAKSFMEYHCALYGSHYGDDQFRLILEVNSMVLNLCPCSKEISPDASAHNQRSKVTVKLESGPLIWIEDIVNIIEKSASSPIYTLLKRQDEKYVMDAAHNEPRFVEDVVRIIASKLDQIDGIHWYSVASENYESIHNHNAYAYIERKCDNTTPL